MIPLHHRGPRLKVIVSQCIVLDLKIILLMLYFRVTIQYNCLEMASFYWLQDCMNGMELYGVSCWSVGLPYNRETVKHLCW